jgi:iron complex outermembrane receptor protein
MGRPAILAALTLVTAVTTQYAGAQGQAGATALEEIIVTARKIEENLQDTPIAISAFSPETLEKRQIFSTDLLDQITPNLQFTNVTTLAGNNASSVVFIRGIGQVDPTASVDPGVGMYIDDIYLGHSVGGSLEFRDIAGVQVLRGSQGTLFGRNTVGGAILLTTQEPGDEFGGNVRFGAGSYDLRDALLAVDIPINEQLKSRFTFGTRNKDGYVTRIQTGEDLGDTNTYTATGKLVWKPNDQFEAKFKFDYTHSDENGNPFVFAASNEAQVFQIVASFDAGCPGSVAFPPPPPVPVPMVNDDRCANDFQNKGPYRNNGTYPLESKLDNWGISLHLAYDLNEDITLKSISAYRSLEWEGIRDADNTPLTILHTDYDSDGEQFTQELQALYRSGPLTGVVGFFYMEEEIDDIVFVQLNTPVPGVQGDSDNNITDNSNWAVFTQWTYDINEQLSITAGGRYTEDTKGSIPDQFNYAAPTVKYLPVILYETTETAFTFSGTVSYRWNEQIMTYFSYAEGFKGGGWNSHFNRPQTPAEQAAFQQFGPEQATTYEIGFKTDLLDDTLRLNGAFFTTDYTDLQFVYRVGVAPYLANAGEASSDGFELELSWVPAENWIIDAGVGYLDTSVDSLVAIAGTAIGVAVGNVLPFSPEWQANGGIGYTASLGNGWLLTPRADLAFQTETFFDANNTLEIAQLEDATVLNLSVALNPPDEKWRLIFGVNNANDELYAIGGNSSLTTSAGYAEIGYARPREWYLTFEYNF